MDLRDWVREKRDLGKGDDEIRKTLSELGYNDEQVTFAFSKPSFGSSMLLWILLLGILLVIILVTLFIAMRQ